MDNNREFFRIALYRVPVQISYFGFRNEGDIRDISGNGISFFSLGNWKHGQRLALRFKIKEETFERTAEIVRVSNENSGKKLYACEFVDQKEIDKSRLSAVLFRIDAERKKK